MSIAIIAKNIMIVMMMMLFKMMMMVLGFMIMTMFKMMMMTTSRVVGAHWHELAATGYIGLILLLITSFTGDDEYDDNDDDYDDNLTDGDYDYLLCSLCS